MEESRIIQKFAGKTILITGCTGFLAKILLEKILRVVPNIKKLFLLIRPSNGRSAEHRLHQEIIDTELFDVLRKKWGKDYSFFLSEKVIPVSGDVSHVNLGITDRELMNGMCEEIDFIINSAATTRFDERYDVAMDINVFGALNVLEFAKRCSKLKLLLHVSTAFVQGTRVGVLEEEALEMGATLEGAKASCLDIQTEKKFIHDAKEKMVAHNINQKDFTSTLRDLGIQRANLHGWPNTYSFTKAMGEMILGDLKDTIPLIILRPTVVSSTLKEPFPGWIQGVKTFDGVFVPYAQRKLKFFLGDLDAVLDVIPGDMVVNCMVVAIAMHEESRVQELRIYHVGTSLTNPIKLGQIKQLMYDYCKDNPLLSQNHKKGMQQLITFTSFSTFQTYIRARYYPFLAILKVLNVIFFNYFETSYTSLRRRINQAMRLARLYEPYLFSPRIFDDGNTQNLRMAASGSHADHVEMFNFDPKSINWEEYFLNIHFPGIVKHVLNL